MATSAPSGTCVCPSPSHSAAATGSRAATAASAAATSPCAVVTSACPAAARASRPALVRPPPTLPCFRICVIRRMCICWSCRHVIRLRLAWCHSFAAALQTCWHVLANERAQHAHVCAGGKCNWGLEASNGVCKKPEPCGGDWQKCCANNSCKWAGLACVDGKCMSCGKEWQPPCNGARLCTSLSARRFCCCHVTPELRRSLTAALGAPTQLDSTPCVRLLEASSVGMKQDAAEA